MGPQTCVTNMVDQTTPLCRVSPIPVVNADQRVCLPTGTQTPALVSQLPVQSAHLRALYRYFHEGEPDSLSGTHVLCLSESL